MHTVPTVRKVPLAKDQPLLISQGKGEVAEFSTGSGLEDTGEFSACRRYK